MSYYELMYVYWKDASLCHSQSFIRLAFETLLFTTSCFDCWRLFELDCHFWMLFVCFLVLYAFPSRLLESSFGCHEKERSSSHLIGWERWSIGKPLRIAMYPPHKCTHTHTHTGTHTVAHHVFIVHDLFGFWRCREVLNSLPFCLFSVFLIVRAALCLVTAVQIQHMKFNEVLNEGFSNWKVWEKTNCFYG